MSTIHLDKAEGFAHVDIRPRPNAAGILQMPALGNAMRVVMDQNNLVLYFFALDADVRHLPDAQVERVNEQRVVVQVAVPPSAKVAIPVADVPKLIAVLNTQLASWNEKFGPGVKR